MRRDLLTRAELPSSPHSHSPPGTTPCNRPRCKTCPTVITSTTITSHSTGHQYPISDSTTCKSTNVIYLIQCQRCGHQYVGETEQPLNERMNNHRADIRHKRLEKPVAVHFTSPHHTADDLRVFVIEKLRRNDPVLRKIRESRWITTLDTP